MRLIDADKAIEATWEQPTYTDPLNVLTEVRDRIRELPTVDAVPVIRCRDCKFLRLTGTVWKCQNRLVMMLCEPNDYCSRAERKEK